MHHLEKAEARAVFEQVRADTASLTVGNKDLEDAVSVMSGYTPSVNFEVDDILMAHPAYQAAYGNRVCLQHSELFELADIYSVVRPSCLHRHKISFRRNNPQVRPGRRPEYSTNHTMALQMIRSTQCQLRQVTRPRNH